MILLYSAEMTYLGLFGLDKQDAVLRLHPLWSPQKRSASIGLYPFESAMKVRLCAEESSTARWMQAVDSIFVAGGVIRISSEF